MCEIPEIKPFELYIGTDEEQNAVVYPLDQLPHLLVCGMNGCGRSSFLRTQTALLAHGTSAEQLRLLPQSLHLHLCWLSFSVGLYAVLWHTLRRNVRRTS